MSTSSDPEIQGTEPASRIRGPLQYISVQGLRSIKSIERLQLRPINVLIVANGNGKTNFLSAFELFHDMAGGDLVRSVGVAGGAERLLHFGSKVTSKIEQEVSKADAGSYRVTLLPTASDRLHVHDEKARTGPCADWQRPTPRAAVFAAQREACLAEAEAWTGREAITRVRNAMLSWRKYHFLDTSATSRIRKAADIDDNRFLRTDGSNLAAFLYYLFQRRPDAYQFIRRTVQIIAPFFDDFRLEPDRLAPTTIKLEWKHRSSDAYFGADSLSDGTLRFMALATLFLQPIEDRPSLILLDEPELGLHPHAVELLASLISSAAVDTQMVVATQSARLVDEFDPEDILVADLVKGATEIHRLSTDELAAWLEDYSLGELWEKSYFGGSS